MLRANATAPATSASAPLTRAIATALADRWAHGSWSDLADTAIDAVADHVRRYGWTAIDKRVADAIADALAAHAALEAEPTDDLVKLEHQLESDDAADYARARCCGASPSEALAIANRYDPQLTLGDVLETRDTSAAERVVALRFADQSLAVRSLDGVRS